MKVFILVLFTGLTMFGLMKFNIMPLNVQSNSVLYTQMFYNLSGFTIKVDTGYNTYLNEDLKKDEIFFYGNESLKDKYNNKKIDNLNVGDYNTLSKYKFRYFNNNLIFQK